MLELDDRLVLRERPPVQPRPGSTRRTRWAVGITAAALLAAGLGYLIADQMQARDHYNRAHTSLGVTHQRTNTVAADLKDVRRDLQSLQEQVGSDTTALNQDSAQLLGAQTSLAAAQEHVTQQASLISSLQTCLVGVEQALNGLAVGRPASAIAALNSVSASCTAADASSG